MLNYEGAMNMDVPSLYSIRKSTPLYVKSQLHYPETQGIISIQSPYYPHRTYPTSPAMAPASFNSIPGAPGKTLLQQHWQDPCSLIL